MTTGNDQRRFPRIPSANTVLVKKIDADLEEFARTKSVGPNGCGFLTETPLGVGAVVEILISVHQRVLNAKARVVYEMPVGEKFEVGVEFIDLSAENRDVLNALLSTPVVPAD
jgi:hypothetical protein